VLLIEPALPAWEVGTVDHRSPAVPLACAFPVPSPLATVRDRDRSL
jgi:hypothetical protein